MSEPYPVALLDYDLPTERIAREPVTPRDRSRLLVLDRVSGCRRNLRFRHLAALLRPGDCVVVNQTRVLPARFFLQRSTGGRTEGLFLSAEPDGPWVVMIKGSARLDIGEELHVDAGEATPGRELLSTRLRLLTRLEGGLWRVQPVPEVSPAELLAVVGSVPLPPYIRRARSEDQQPESAAADWERYQTIYATDPGSVAAPTAGLHFTPEVLEELGEAGVALARVTLHVGLGTFQPVSAADLSAHVMHAEPYEVSVEAAETINAARAAGSRVIAVGTTTTRVLESCADDRGRLRPGTGQTDLLIRPGHRWRLVDGLVTNFHLPRSTLLALVFAFAGRDSVLSAYRAAIADGYRFYSYGDAMLIL